MLRRRDQGGGSQRRAGKGCAGGFDAGTRLANGGVGRSLTERMERMVAMIYGAPETPRFLAAVQRLKREQHRKAQQTRLAKQRVRLMLRKLRDR